MIRFKCPQCGGSLEAPESSSGEEINCLGCGYLVQIPSPQDDFFRFPCPSCGKRLKAKPEDTGKKTHCIKCGTPFAVPAGVPPARVVLSAPVPVRVSRLPDSSRNRVSLTLESLSVGHILIGMFVVWAVLILLSVVTVTIAKWHGVALALLTCLITLGFASLALDLMRAKMRAMKKREVAYAWRELLGVVAWDPNEGVLFLKDKKVAFVNSDHLDGGGIMLLLPWLGEEVVYRVPLEVRTTKFIDQNVLTREYVPLTIKGAIYWRLTDLQSFYLSVVKAFTKSMTAAVIASRITTIL